MDWISWVLPVLIALPLVGGVLAGIISSDRVRYTLVTLLAVLIAAGGIGVEPLHTGRNLLRNFSGEAQELLSFFHLTETVHLDGRIL